MVMKDFIKKKKKLYTPWKLFTRSTWISKKPNFEKKKKEGGGTQPVLQFNGGGVGKARFNVATPTNATVTCTAYVLPYNLQTKSI